MRQRAQVQALPPQQRGTGAAGRVVSPMRPVPAHIARPPYADTGDVDDLGRAAHQVGRDDRADAGHRQARRRDPPPRRRAGAAGRHHRGDRRLRPRAVHRARLLSVAAQLQRLPEERLHLGQRGDLPRHPRLAPAAGRRHRQPRRHRLSRRRARRHQRHVLRRRRRPRRAASSCASPRRPCGSASRRSSRAAR